MNRDCSTNRTIDCLLAFIAAHGIPRTLVGDNGPQVTSHAFKKFCLQNGIRHKCTQTYYPASNSKLSVSYKSCTEILLKVQLMLLLLALSTSCLLLRFHCEATGLDHFGPQRSFRPGDAVLVPNTHNGSALKWQEGLVQQRLGPVSYVVKLGDLIRHVDIDHLRNSSASESFPISTKYVVKHSYIDYLLPVLTKILPRL